MTCDLWLGRLRRLAAEFGGGLNSSKAAARLPHSKNFLWGLPAGYYLLRSALQRHSFVLVFFSVPPFTRQAAGPLIENLPNVLTGDRVTVGLSSTVTPSLKIKKLGFHCANTCLVFKARLCCALIGSEVRLGLSS